MTDTIFNSQRNALHYRNTLAAIDIAADTGLLDLTEDGYAFLTQDKVWIGTDRSNARRCIEAVVYGSLDKLGIPRVKVPAEFVAAVICTFVKPTNFLTACKWMEGCSWTENVIKGVEKPVDGNVLFAHVICVRAGLSDELINSKLTKLAEVVGVDDGEG